MRRLLPGLAAAFALGAGSAAAAPQALMVAAGGGEVHLACSGTDCRAEISTFCLQPDRPNPEFGHRYNILAMADQQGAIRLVGYRNDGSEVVLPLESSAVLTAERDHSAVMLTVPAPVLHEHGVRRLSVRVSEPVMLVPQAVAGDSRTQDGEDLAFLATTARQAALYTIDEHPDQVGATRIVRDVLNGVPADRPTTPSERQTAWSQAEPGRETSGARFIARTAYNGCKHVTAVGDVRLYGFRSCMGVMPAEIIGEVNDAYAEWIGAGS
ncbi:MAG: hypothetical protein OXF51_09350 [Alphaproteobacteria bacterium]|nr:hypothetical protein [Alphaproteobacteria bacterium]